MTPGQKWYRERLKDPLWTRKRYEILVRDDFKCTVEGCDGGGLQVDHKKYLPGRKPWEYPNELLQTLCEVHHEIKTIAERGFVIIDTHAKKKKKGLSGYSAHQAYRPRFVEIKPIKHKTREEWDAFHAKYGIKNDTSQ